MITGILGKKIGMTQVFDENGDRISVTVLEAGPCTVQDIKNKEKHGYTAVQLGYDDIPVKKLNKPQAKNLEKKNLKAKRFVKEIRCLDVSNINIGDEVKNNIFRKGDYLDIIGISKGKGFQGGMKRCNWYGGCETHGSMSHRRPGSIGASSFPKRVHKGHPFPGHMGSDKVTAQNIEVVYVDADAATIAVNGSVPGANGAYLTIKLAKKKKFSDKPKPAVQSEKDGGKKAKAEVKDKAKKAPAKEAKKDGKK